MIAFFAVTILTTVLGFDPNTQKRQCTHIHGLIWDRETASENPCPVEARNFEKCVDIVQIKSKSDENERNYFVSVETDDQPLPTISVDGSDFELSKINVLLLHQPSKTVAFQFTFVNYEIKNCQQYVSLVVPLLTTHHIDADIMRWSVDRTVQELATGSEEKVGTISLHWLQPLLDHVIRIDHYGNIVGSVCRYPNDEVLMTECERADFIGVWRFFPQKSSITDDIERAYCDLIQESSGEQAVTSDCNKTKSRRAGTEQGLQNSCVPRHDADNSSKMPFLKREGSRS